MANRLKKVASVRYSAGTPAVAAVVGYTTYEKVWVPGYYAPQLLMATNELGYQYLYIVQGPYVEGHYEIVKKVVPSTPARAATDPVFSYSAIAGWNGGARSRQVMPGDGFVSFTVGPNPRGVVVGLTSNDTDTTPGDIDFGFYVHGTVAEVYENGVSVFTYPSPVDSSTEYGIWRELGVIGYTIAGFEEYVSLKTTDNPLLLDASLYSTGDFVDDPEFLLYDPYGEGGSTMPPYNVYGIEGTKANGMSKMPSYTIYGTAGLHGSGGLTMPSYRVTSSDFAYASGSSVMPALASVGDGGYPSLTLQYGMSYVTPSVTFAHGFTGEVGGGTSELRGYVVIGSDYPYSYGGTSHLGVVVRGRDDTSLAGEHSESDAILFSDYYVPVVNHSATFAEGLGLSDEYVLQVLDGETYFDSLLMGNVLAVQQAIDVVFMSALTLGDSSGVSSVGSRQYATNMLTNAVSPYANFNFLSFARCGQETYAVKQDGLYRIRQGDDDGTPVSANVDFGEPVIGSRTNLQHIEDMFFGVDTDGELYAKLTVDGTVYTYAVRRRGELSRAVLPRGLRGRSWNIELEIVDASTLDLEFMEVHTDAARRWSTK